MIQVDLFPPPQVNRTLALEPSRPDVKILTYCPRCREPKASGDNWIISLGGSHRGIRCSDCWEKEL